MMVERGIAGFFSVRALLCCTEGKSSEGSRQIPWTLEEAQVFLDHAVQTSNVNSA